MSTEYNDRQRGAATPMHAVTSTVSGYATGIALTAIAGVIAAASVAFASIPVMAKVIVVAVVVLTSVVVAVLPARLSVAVSEDGVRYRSGTGRFRWISAESIEAAEALRVGYGAIVGMGITPAMATDRRIVRAGWVLHLRLRSREDIWLSTRGPLDVRAVLAADRHTKRLTVREGNTR